MRKTSGSAVDSLFISAPVALGSNNTLPFHCNGAYYLTGCSSLSHSLVPHQGARGHRVARAVQGCWGAPGLSPAGSTWGQAPRGITDCWAPHAAKPCPAHEHCPASIVLQTSSHEGHPTSIIPQEPSHECHPMSTVPFPGGPALGNAIRQQVRAGCRAWGCPYSRSWGHRGRGAPLCLPSAGASWDRALHLLQPAPTPAGAAGLPAGTAPHGQRVRLAACSRHITMELRLHK